MLGMLALLRQFIHSTLGYPGWIEKFDSLSMEDQEAIHRHISKLPFKPVISIIMPVFNTSENWLEQAIESVRAQLYPHWELCIADDASTAPHVRSVLRKYAEMDGRIRIVHREQNGHISAASNSALELARGEFIALLDHDDELPRHALYMVVATLNEKPHLDIIYSDEDKIDENGRRFDPYFKPDWNPDLFTAQNMLSHLGVYRTEVVRAVGCFRVGYEGSQDWDMALRVSERIPSSNIFHIPNVLYHWRAIPGSTAVSHDEKAYVKTASQRAVNDHLQRLDKPATTQSAFSSFVRVRYLLPDVLPLVSIIATNTDASGLRRCLETLRDCTRYPSIEILISGHGDDLAVVSEMGSSHLGLRFLPVDAHLCPQATVNNMVKAANGSLICFFNAALVPLGEDWLREMVSHALRPEIGVVGGMLLNSEKRIHTAALVFVNDSNCAKVAISFYQGYPHGEKGYAGRAALPQNVSAVSPDCMVLRKEIFEAVGGFDDSVFLPYLAGLDLCLRIRQLQYYNLWTPYSELYFASALSSNEMEVTDLAYRAEVEHFRNRWHTILESDPANNPNLATDTVWPHLALIPRVTKPWRQ